MQKLITISFGFDYDELKQKIGESVSDEVFMGVQNGYEVESCNYDEMESVVEQLLLEQIQSDIEEQTEV